MREKWFENVLILSKDELPNWIVHNKKENNDFFLFLKKENLTNLIFKAVKNHIFFQVL